MSAHLVGGCAISEMHRTEAPPIRECSADLVSYGCVMNVVSAEILVSSDTIGFVHNAVLSDVILTLWWLSGFPCLPLGGFDLER